MDIGSIGNVASAYQYVNQIKNKQVSSSGFASSLKEATSLGDKVDSFKTSLQENFGRPITVASVVKDQNSMDRFAGSTVGFGNVTIARIFWSRWQVIPKKRHTMRKKYQIIIIAA